jgi:hypothetical protein
MNSTIENGQIAGPAFAAHEIDERNRQAGQQHCQADAEGGGEPQRLRGDPPRRPRFARALQARHLSSRAVGRSQARHGPAEHSEAASYPSTK